MPGSSWEDSLHISPLTGATYSSSLENFLMPGDFILFDQPDTDPDGDFVNLKRVGSVLSGTTGEQAVGSSLVRRSIDVETSFKVLVLAPIDSVALSEQERARKLWKTAYGHMGDEMDAINVEMLPEMYFTNTTVWVSDSKVKDYAFVVHAGQVLTGSMPFAFGMDNYFIVRFREKERDAYLMLVSPHQHYTFSSERCSGNIHCSPKQIFFELQELRRCILGMLSRKTQNQTLRNSCQVPCTDLCWNYLKRKCGDVEIDDPRRRRTCRKNDILPNLTTTSIKVIDKKETLAFCSTESLDKAKLVFGESLVVGVRERFPKLEKRANKRSRIEYLIPAHEGHRLNIVMHLDGNKSGSRASSDCINLVFSTITKKVKIEVKYSSFLIGDDLVQSLFLPARNRFSASEVNNSRAGDNLQRSIIVAGFMFLMSGVAYKVLGVDGDSVECFRYSDGENCRLSLNEIDI